MAKSRALGLVVGLLLVAAGVGVYAVAGGRLSPSPLDASFARLRVGMSAAEVEAVLGPGPGAGPGGRQGDCRGVRRRGRAAPSPLPVHPELLVRRAAAAGEGLLQGRPVVAAEAEPARPRRPAPPVSRAARWAGRGWTEAERAKLGTMPDEELAAQTGRTAVAVRMKRRKANVPADQDRSRRR